MLGSTTAPVYKHRSNHVQHSACAHHNACVHCSACARQNACLHHSIRVQRNAGVHHSACVHSTGRKSMYVRICCGQVNATPRRFG
eukprot:853728-Pyramimonas_sp.AAC.1